jgi:hypothetical protein
MQAVGVEDVRAEDAVVGAAIVPRGEVGLAVLERREAIPLRVGPADVKDEPLPIGLDHLGAERGATIPGSPVPAPSSSTRFPAKRA